MSQHDHDGGLDTALIYHQHIADARERGQGTVSPEDHRTAAILAADVATSYDSLAAQATEKAARQMYATAADKARSTRAAHLRSAGRPQLAVVAR